MLSLTDKIALATLASLGVLAVLYAWEIELARQALEGAVLCQASTGGSAALGGTAALRLPLAPPCSEGRQSRP